jgi:hypothetical protein
LADLIFFNIIVSRNALKNLTVLTLIFIPRNGPLKIQKLTFFYQNSAIRTVLKLFVIRFLKITADRTLPKNPIFGYSLKSAKRTVQNIKTVFQFLQQKNGND